MGLMAMILAALAAGAIAPPLVARAPRFAGWLLAIVPAGITIALFTQVDRVVEGGPVLEVVSWVPSLGLQAAFQLDGLGMLFALLISGIGALVVVYSGGYLKGDRRLGRFYLILFGFMASMLGVALADNVILLYVFWALTGLTSYLLIGFDSHRPTARKAALQALLTTFAGELALLAGVLMLAQAGGSYELSVLVERGDRIAADPLFVPMMVLLVAGALTKSAQFPFHYWLPNAMEAPTPVSAYLHSATMVKAGVYLLARISPIFAGTDLWLYLVGGAGAITMLIGGFLALHQTDLKRLLAYSTVSALGIMTFLLGIGTEYAVNAAVVFLLGHALYKGTLFLIAGILDHETGMRDASRLSGLRRAMPVTRSPPCSAPSRWPASCRSSASSARSSCTRRPSTPIRCRLPSSPSSCCCRTSSSCSSPRSSGSGPSPGPGSSCRSRRTRRRACSPARCCSAVSAWLSGPRPGGVRHRAGERGGRLDHRHAVRPRARAVARPLADAPPQRPDARPRHRGVLAGCGRWRTSAGGPTSARGSVPSAPTRPRRRARSGARRSSPDAPERPPASLPVHHPGGRHGPHRLRVRRPRPAARPSAAARRPGPRGDGGRDHRGRPPSSRSRPARASRRSPRSAWWATASRSSTCCSAPRTWR
jgi:formate hydrogenlyase subunit 3/multisubunit Na+/H+ antiporter MnhD subunit